MRIHSVRISMLVCLLAAAAWPQAQTPSAPPSAAPAAAAPAAASAPQTASSSAALNSAQALAAEDRLARESWLPRAEATRADRVTWWRDSRFGMFIHWGVYSTLAGEWEGEPVKGYAEHIMRIERIPRQVYLDRVASQFNPTAFNADAWVGLLKRAGMKYLVITSKHHDGFAMFDSQVSSYNIVKATPFHRDPMRELRDACRRAGIRFGFYYSHAEDVAIALPAAAPDAVDTVIALDLAGEPDADRAVLLRAGETQLHVFDGEATSGIRFGDGKRTRDTTVGWDDPAASISWKLRLSAPARVTVDVEYAAGEKDGGTFEIRVGDQRLSGTVAPTPADPPFVRKTLDTLTLPAGHHTIAIAPTRIDGALMRLRSLRLVSAPATATPDMAALSRSASRVVPGDAATTPDMLRALVVRRNCRNTLCAPTVKNNGSKPVRVKEVVLFSLGLALPPETHLYGEGFQMLSQIGGTLGQPVDLGYSEVKHYKMPQPSDAAVASGLLTLTPPGRSSCRGPDSGPDSGPVGGPDCSTGPANTALYAFTSSHRFIGRFYVRPASLDIIVDTEGLTLAPGETWQLEQFMFASGPARPMLLEALARQIARNHPPLQHATAPTGWCSWYCFGPRVTAKQVLDNLDTIAERIPRLRYVQIDDGYQPAMGDWLETGKAFGGDVTGVLEQIRARGFEPAIWVAPFIAEADSHLFREHPDWFVKGDDGKPLPSDRVTFGGWRRGPWYALDGTHPEVQKHFEELFRTMRQKWGATYFKLDANFWGTIHGGHFHDPKATRVEAYRRGMEAILRGAGDSFILGCNHPIWPSFGLIHGSRSSQDIKRAWNTIRLVALQNLNRNWQNGRLWWNDPDAVVLTGDLTEDEIRFHATATYASGGMILSGDDLTQIPPARLAMLQTLLPPTGVAATFEDDSLRVGVMARSNGQREFALLNWEDRPQTIAVTLPAPCAMTDVWSGESLGRHEGRFTAPDMPPHSARLLACKPDR